MGEMKRTQQLAECVREMCQRRDVQEVLQYRDIVLEWCWGASTLGAAMSRQKYPDYVLVINRDGIAVKRSGYLSNDESARFDDSIIRWIKLLKYDQCSDLEKDAQYHRDRIHQKRTSY
jgi:hypothetical protein